MGSRPNPAVSSKRSPVGCGRPSRSGSTASRAVELRGLLRIFHPESGHLRFSGRAGQDVPGSNASGDVRWVPGRAVFRASLSSTSVVAVGGRAPGFQPRAGLAAVRASRRIYRAKKTISVGKNRKTPRLLRRMSSMYSPLGIHSVLHSSTLSEDTDRIIDCAPRAGAQAVALKDGK